MLRQPLILVAMGGFEKQWIDDHLRLDLGGGVAGFCTCSRAGVVPRVGCCPAYPDPGGIQNLEPPFCIDLEKLLFSWTRPTQLDPPHSVGPAPVFFSWIHRPLSCGRIVIFKQVA